MLNISIFNPISTKHLFTKKRIAIVSVVNDLVTDSRVNRTCNVLIESGYEVVLIGRKLKHSPDLPAWPFKAKRMKLLFTKGPLFYFFFNLRLFLKLLGSKADLLFANDLDTLWPNYLVSKWKKIPLVYDSHELFCDVPELMQAPFKRKIWKSLEKHMVPKLNYCITVNKSIAALFEKEYKTPFLVIRNIPEFPPMFHPKTRSELGLPQNKKILILQGAGINIDRGAEELVDAMAAVDDVLLLIIGGGDVWQVLQQKILLKKLENKIWLLPRMSKDELMHYTSNADLGVSIDKNTNPNYYNSLPNKVFDYLHAGIPILASRLPEIEQIITTYQVGFFIASHEPSVIAAAIEAAVHTDLETYKQNAIRACADLNWKNEKEKYLEFIRQISV